VDLLGLRRSALHQPHGAEDVEEELQELRLPVLADVDGEVRGREVLEQGDLLEPVHAELLVELRPPGQRLAGQDDEKGGAEGQREAVVVPEAAATAAFPVPAVPPLLPFPSRVHRCIAPIAMK
jgi:hypothetical protein